MATVTTKLTVSSSDLTSQILSLSLSKAITASHTTGLARTKVGQTAVQAYGTNATSVVEWMVFGVDQ